MILISSLTSATITTPTLGSAPEQLTNQRIISGESNLDINITSGEINLEIDIISGQLMLSVILSLVSGISNLLDISRSSKKISYDVRLMNIKFDF